MSKKKEKKQEVVLKRINETIDNLNKKEFTMYFFTVDSKNVPNGSMRYIYQLAKGFNDSGYKVCMLYQIDDEYTLDEMDKIIQEGGQPDQMKRFIGVGQWMGEEYASLPHMNIQKEQWMVGPSDFLFIPEVFSSFMYNVYKNHIPCKRYVILQNYDYLTEFIPIGQQWANYGIDHVIANTQAQADKVNEVFPYTKKHTTVINPCIPGYFRKPIKAKKLIVNIIAKNQDDVHRIVKPFYWKNPEYQFVTFKDIRNYTMTELSDALKESAITVWVDEKTPFGYTAIESLRCGNILIGKIPEEVPEWMTENNGIWFTNIYDVPEILGKVIKSWMNDNIPEEIIKGIDDTNNLYTEEVFNRNIEDFGKKMVEERVNELVAVKNVAKNNNQKEIQ